MRANLKTILSAAAAAALVASPALAKSQTRTHRSILNVPYDARASVPGIPYDARGSVGGRTVHPYGAEIPVPSRAPANNAVNPDFQLGGSHGD
jgi:hypothetical protein